MTNSILGTLSFFFFLASSLWAAVPHVDSSTPKGTLKGVFDLSVAGDFDGRKKLFVAPANDKEKELLEEGFGDDLSTAALSAACLEKFPDAKVSNPAPMLERAQAEIAKMVEKINGDTATLMPAAAPSGGGGPSQPPLVLKKVDGAWKLTITESILLRMPPPQFKVEHKARGEAMEQFIKDVKAGKYASHDQLKEAMKQKDEELRKKHLRAPQSNVGNSPSAHPLDDPNSSEDDKKAVEILKATDILIEQKNAVLAEAKLLEVFPLKSKLSAKVRERVPFTILSLIMLDPERGKKLRPQWDKL